MSGLPSGKLISWYGDDFTGSSAVMDVLSAAGIKSVLFLDVPDAGLQAEFADCQAIGIAGVARAHSPDWMDRNLPAVFEFMATVGAPIAHYKICSTLDSSPTAGSIGHAISLAQPVLGGEWCPIMVAAPELGRYQAFGNVFARAGDTTYRLDRHPVMSRHPVTPMDEADIRRHLMLQTDVEIGLLSLEALRSNEAADAVVDEAIASGKPVAVDAMDRADMVAAGRAIWERRGERLLAVGSQGIEYALIEYWREAGLIGPVPADPGANAVDQIVVVSGSVSQLSAQQIAWAQANGFEGVPLDAARLLSDGDFDAAVGDAVERVRAALATGRSVVVHTALGPDDPAVGRFNAALSASGLDPAEGNARVGRALGRILSRILDQTDIQRVVVSGGDTSGFATMELGVRALTLLATTVPGAALCTAYRNEAPPIQLALKGGQMGPENYYGWIRNGKSPDQTGLGRI